MKKIFSLFLTLIMLLAVFPVSVYADESGGGVRGERYEATDEDFEIAMQFLADSGAFETGEWLYDDVRQSLEGFYSDVESHGGIICISPVELVNHLGLRFLEYFSDGIVTSDQSIIPTLEHYGVADFGKGNYKPHNSDDYNSDLFDYASDNTPSVPFVSVDSVSYTSSKGYTVTFDITHGSDINPNYYYWHMSVTDSDGKIIVNTWSFSGGHHNVQVGDISGSLAASYMDEKYVFHACRPNNAQRFAVDCSEWLADDYSVYNPDIIFHFNPDGSITDDDGNIYTFSPDGNLRDQDGNVYNIDDDFWNNFFDYIINQYYDDSDSDDNGNIDLSGVIGWLQRIYNRIDRFFNSFFDNLKDVFIGDLNSFNESSYVNDLSNVINRKFSFLLSLNDIITGALDSYSNVSDTPVINVPYNGKTYEITFDLFDNYIDKIRILLAAYIYLSFAFITYRRIPSYINNGGDT